VEGRAFAGFGGEGDRSAVFLDDLVGDCGAQPGAVFLAVRDECVEEVVAYLLRDTGTRVGDLPLERRCWSR